MKRILTTLLLMAGSKMLKNALPQRESMMEMSRLRAYAMYIRGVKSVRMLFIGRLFMGACLGFLFFGLVLLHVSLFIYSPWDDEVKMWIGLAMAVAYITGSIYIFKMVFSEKEWLKIFHVDKMADKLRKTPEPQEHYQGQVA
jgi:uncharacterized membrane protein